MTRKRKDVKQQLLDISNPLLQKAAIYVRVSTHWQIDKDSLPVQREELINYCKYILNLESFEIFEDAGYSAKNIERPAYQQMMSRLRMGEFSHLLVWNIVHMIYDLYEQEKSILIVAKTLNEKGYKSRRGIAWSSVTINIILSNPFYQRSP